MKRSSILFLLLLALLLFVIFGVHVFILNLIKRPPFGNLLILSYIINYFLAMVVLIAVERTLSKNTGHAGFVFMAGSGIKFLFFFLIFYPFYRADGIMQTIEFTTFFIPYTVCLTTEVIYLSKQLNDQ